MASVHVIEVARLIQQFVSWQDELSLFGAKQEINNICFFLDLRA